MGLTPFITTLPSSAPSAEQAWLTLVRAQVDRALESLLSLPDEVRLDAAWAQALERVRAQVLSPAARARPALLLAGYCLARGSTVVPAGLWRFVAGLELLHVSQQVHAEARTEAGSPQVASLAGRLGPGLGRTGDHLAVVVGDHLFARALESMLEAEVPGAEEATGYCLRLFRATAAGVFRAQQGGGLLEPGGVRRALGLTRLRAVHEGLATSLVCGALLAQADEALRLRLARVGCGVGLAQQLRQEADAPLGFPVVAAWSRARPEVRDELAILAVLPREARDGAVVSRVRHLVDEAGGRAATETLVARSTQGARRAFATLPNPSGVRDLLQVSLGALTHPMVRGDAP